MTAADSRKPDAIQREKDRSIRLSLHCIYSILAWKSASIPTWLKQQRSGGSSLSDEEARIVWDAAFEKMANED